METIKMADVSSGTAGGNTTSPYAEGKRMTTRPGLFRAWCAQAWRHVLLASQAMAGCDLTGQLTGWGSAQDPGVPAEWAPTAHLGRMSHVRSCQRSRSKR